MILTRSQFLGQLRRLGLVLAIAGAVVALASAHASAGCFVCPSEPARPHMLAIAERYIGHRNPTGFRGPWCKAFVNLVLGRAGLVHSRSLRAIDALRDGARVAQPRPGDLVVMRHHVAFFAGWGGRGVVAVGGNQGRGHVTVASFPRRRVLAFVRPVGRS